MANQPKKYKKFVATAATATLVASAIVPVASAASLSDIAGNTHEEAITSLVDAGVINGYPDGTFQPNKTLTRSDVVKLLGKYLVSKGLEVPADYKTNVRFNDLTSASNDELLKYAAVVYDAGVFNGSNGNLLAGDNITRENMAVVLVRAFDTLNNIDLVSYVQGQEYKKDVKDLYTAKSEARAAIEVLDFFDITNPSVANFNPKGSTTRGQFATFLYKTINSDFSAVTGVANSAVSEIKAINNTTVEVTFKDAVDNIEALDFTIDGLEVKNAVVKQTDAKTVVLTTAPQTGDTVYTVNVNAAKAGTFKGVSAVVPTAVTITTPSVQGKLGQQVTVKAQVTVAEGQSKAGIPVTLFVPGSADGLKAPVTVEAVTNAEGVATYTYTRYAATTDNVTAYASGDRSKFSTGYVFWGVEQILTIEEVTTGSTINNGANKTYKVTFKNPETGKAVANKTLNVSVLENINVTANKLQNVTVNGIEVAQLSNSTITRAAQITTDSKGEATFTVSGTNAEATPVVFEAFNTVANGVDYKYDASDLQATAAKVKFAAIQAEYTIELTRDGGEVAATGQANGREYKVVVKDKDGKVAKNETVNIAFSEDLDRVIATNTKAGFVNTDTDTFYPTSGTGNTKKQISIKTNDKGEASFVVASEDVNDYATPQAWIDVNSANAKQGSLDEGEPTTIGAISHFQAPYLDGAEVKAYKAGKATKNFDGAETAEFKAELVNQSGKVFTGGYTVNQVTYTVFNTGAEDIKVGSTVISPNRSETFTTTGSSLSVTSAEGKTTSVRVVATGSARKDGKDFAFTAKEATATFTNSAVVAAPYTGYVKEFNALDSGSNSNSLWFVGKNPIKYTGTGVKYFGANGNEIFGEAAWEAYLTSLVGRDVQVSYSKDGDNTIFKVISETSGSVSPLVKTSAPTPVVTNTGVLALTSSSSSTSLVDVSNAETLTVSLNDADLNVNKTAVDSATVALSDGTNTALTLTLVETGVDTGIFVTTVQAGTLATLNAGTLTATYADAKNAAGNAQTITDTISLKKLVGAITQGTFTQAVAGAAAKPAEYTTRDISPTYTFATETFSLKIDAAPAQTINLAGKVGAQGVADAINAAFSGSATVSGDRVVIKGTSAAAGGTVVVASSGVTQIPDATTVFTPVVNASAANQTFTISSPLSVGEKVVIDGVEYTAVAFGTTPTATTFVAESAAGTLATATVQAANLATAITTNTADKFSATDATGTITLTSTETPTGTTITAPVITLK